MSRSNALSDASISLPPAWVRTAVLGATILLCAFPFSVPIADPDLWGHVQYAQDWLRDGQLARTASHTFTAVDYPWINHENLSELTLALGYQWVGVSGLLIAKCFLGVLILLLVVRRAESHGVDLAPTCLLLVLLSASLHVFWLLRPQLATFAGLVAWILLLERAFAEWSERREVDVRWLWLYPLIQFVWTNAHGGFLAGFLLFAFYLSGRTLELWTTAGSATRPRRKYYTLHFAAVLAVTTATLFANPYGLGLVRWLIASLRVPRPEIVEWGRPDLLAPLFWPYFGLVFLTLAAWLVSNRQRDWVHASVLTLVAWQSLSHIRHVGLFAILTVFLGLPHFQSLWARLSRGGGISRSAPRHMLYGATACLIAVATLWPLANRVAWLRVDRQLYPVDAVHYMREHGLTGRLVVSFNWAQYAIAALQPDVQVAFDGRFRTCYPQSIIDMHFDLLLGDVETRYRAENSGPVSPAKVLSHKTPDLVLLDRSFPHSTRFMQTQATYVLLYQDAVAQLWGRRSKYDNPQQVTFLPESKRKVSEELPEGNVPWPAIPKPLAGRGRGKSCDAFPCETAQLLRERRD